MLSDLADRALLALVIMAVGLVLYLAWNQAQLRRLGRRQAAAAPGLEGFRPGVAAIVYFTTPECAPCRTVQRPALDRLQAELGEDRLQVIQVDASQQPAVADYWGVISVPTTFVLDGAGRPRRVNHGAASQEKLRRQLAELEGSPAAAPAELEHEPARAKL